MRPYDEEEVEKPEVAPSVRDVISSRLGAQDTKLAGLQKKAASGRSDADLSEGLGQVIQGISRSNEKFDPSFYRGQKEAASAPVKDYVQRQAARKQGLEQLGGEEKFAQQQEALDPTSPRSQVVGAILGRYNPSLKGQPIAAVDAPLVQGLEKSRESAEARKESSKATGLYHQGLLDQKIEDGFKTNLLKNKGYSQADMTANAADTLAETVKNAVSNPVAAASLPTELGLFASKGQRLHGATIDAFTNPNGSLMGRLQTAMAKGGKGTIPQDIANDIVSYLELEKHGAKLQKDQVTKQEAESFFRQHGRFPRSYAPDVGGSAAPAPAPRAPAAPATGPHGPTVQQNGHTYNWNPQTGRYE